MNLYESPLPPCESLTVEFKSDRSCLADRDLVEALVCLANTEGGELWLGVEDDGTPSGLHKDHQNLLGLAGMVAAKTSPTLSISVHEHFIGAVKVAKIVVPKTPYIVATVSGVYVRRRLKHDGTPECVPLLPHEQPSRYSHFGRQDASAQAVPDATLADFDPLERERLRQAIVRFGGERALLELDDKELDGVLGLTTCNAAGERVPTLAGLLIIGRETALREKVPTHEFAFQVLAREAVQLNEFHRFPLLKALEWLETNFRPYNPEDEMLFGMHRVPIPKVDLGAFREAVANALIHRDYHRLGTVYVRVQDEVLSMSNPGGLVEGVTLRNLLVIEPRPRNPILADALKRIGVVERSGRGVDKIYRGVLKFGRAAPDYSRSDRESVMVRLAMTNADKDFLRLVLSEEQRRDVRELAIDDLVILAALRSHNRLDGTALAQHIQRDDNDTHTVLERLLELGLIEAHGSNRHRSFTLSADLYRAEGRAIAYTRQKGLSRARNEQMVLAHIENHGEIRRPEVMELCHMDVNQAARLLRKLKQEKQIVQKGKTRAAFYVFPERANNEDNSS